MIVALVVAALAVLAGVLRGGSLDSLARTRLRWVALLFAGLGLQTVAALAGEIGEGTALVAAVMSNAAVVAFLLLNRALPGVGLAALGLVLNLVVIVPNGAMPVSVRAIEIASGRPPPKSTAPKHELMDEHTRLRVLGDWIPVPATGVIVSIGDLLLALGIGRLVYARMTAERNVRSASG